MEGQQAPSASGGADGAAPLGKCSLVGGPYAATREFFLRGLSACYFAAFASFLVQVPGLYGPQGLAPAEDPQAFERCCVWGLALSVLGLIGFGNVPVMWSMLQLYAFLVRSAPPPFYNFQWDILLLEAGLLGGLLAPLLHPCLEPRPSRAVIWMLRLVLFKLMLMSGIVKITEGDSSWTDLTAIWYHFATQCIPTPFAWFFHNMPIPLEKFFCACCFAIEIPAAFLILVPVWHVQVVAALLQIMLQLVIIVTGNYTFFNYLTICISCTLLDHRAIPWFCRPAEPMREPLAHVLALGGVKLPAQDLAAADTAAKLLSQEEHGEAVDTSPLLAAASGSAGGPDPPEASGSGSGGGGGGGGGSGSGGSSGSGASEGAPARGLGMHAEGGGAAGPIAELLEAAAAVAGHGSAEGALKHKALAQIGLSPAAQRRAWALCGWCILAFCAALALWYSVGLGLNGQLAVQVTDSELKRWASQWVPRALVLVSLVIPVVTFFDIIDAVLVDTPALFGAQPRIYRRPAWLPLVAMLLAAGASALLLIRAVACQRILERMPSPLAEVAPSLRDPRTRTSFWHAGSPRGREFQMPLGLPHYGPFPYGLFRSMTGIGPHGEVARPEVVIEVREAASGKWLELQFPYKPGDLNRRPPIVAPYQPRLDWQMWFQALTPFPEDWFDMLLQRITEGSPAALSLLDTASLPDLEVSSVRAVVYSYNYTTYGQPGWWRRTSPPRNVFVPAQKFPRPLNLARAAAGQPHDWRVPVVWAFLGAAVLLWLSPLVVRFGLAWAQGRAAWWQSGAADLDRKDA